MNDLFTTAINQWFELETKARAAEKAAKAGAADLSFYLQMLEVALEQAEVAPLNKAAEAVEYCRNTANSAKIAQDEVSKLEEQAASARSKANFYKGCIKQTLSC